MKECYICHDTDDQMFASPAGWAQLHWSDMTGDRPDRFADLCPRCTLQLEERVMASTPIEPQMRWP